MDLYMILTFLLSILVTMFSRMIYLAYRRRRLLNWIPEVPGVPILGNVLQVQKSTETLNVFANFLRRFSGLCRVNFVYDTSILSSDPKFLEFVLSSHKLLNKSREYDFLTKWLGWGLLTAPAARWRKNRKIITPAFHFSILEQFVDTFESNGQIMVDILDEHLDKIFNIYPFVTMCTLDAICETAMGVSINAQRNAHSEYVFCVKEMCRITIDRAFSLKRYDLMYPLYKDFYNEKQYVKVLHALTNSVIKSRKEELVKGIPDSDDDNEGSARKKLAFLDLMLKAQRIEQDFSDTVIREEVDTFMFEGHDTTTSAICFVLYCLANHPEYQEVALKEQKALFGDDRNKKATFRDLQEMKFLELVIKESLRLYPSVPYYSRFVTEDIEYKDGHIIPKDTNLILFAFGSNRSPELFQNPDLFNPYRFETMESKQWHYSYIPFSAGPRNCIGQKFAMLEIKSIISKMLRNYVIHSGGPENEVILLAEAVLTSLNGFHLKLSRRHW